MTKGLGYQTERRQQADLPSAGDENGERDAPPCLPWRHRPQEEWRTGSAVQRFSSGTGWYVSNVGEGATCSTLVV